MSCHFFLGDSSLFVIFDHGRQEIVSIGFVSQASVRQSIKAQKIKIDLETNSSTLFRLYREFWFLSAKVDGKNSLANVAAKGRRRRLSTKVIK